MRIKSWPLMAVGLICLLASCGGSDGGGIGGTGKTHTIENDGLILGTVNGFGSIVINDQRFDTQNAEFIVDGKVASITDLQIGMNIGARVNFTKKQASEVVYQPLVAGPIDSTNGTFTTLSILGQSILITAETVLDGLTNDALRPGLVIEVSGTRDSMQSIVADYISIAPADTPHYTVGVINQVSPENYTALLSGTVINFPNAGDPSNSTAEPYGQLMPGNRVRVEAPRNPTVVQTNGSGVSIVRPESANGLTVTNIQTVRNFRYTRGSRVDITGRINTFSSDGIFIVSGVTVFTDVTTKFYSKYGILIDNPILTDKETVMLEGTAIGPHRITAQKITLTDRL